eukprot:Tbor_TRINITY_DN3069_c0_g1::TRINITY_DN3069_c0_g1_i1::g.17329::m.17329
MLKSFFRGEDSSSADAQPVDKKPSQSRRALLEQDPAPVPEPTESEQAELSKTGLKKKLRDQSFEKQPNPNTCFGFENAFRNPSRILMSGNHQETEGLNIQMSRAAHNAKLTSKWVLGTPQQSNWEISAQVHGFSDLIVASYSTMKRWSLMYQRPFSSGALMVLQATAQPSMMQLGGPPGGFFGLLQYPWVHGGLSIVQFIKGHQVSISHTQRIIRGLHVGAQMAYSPQTQNSYMSYVAHSVSTDNKYSWSAEVKPDSGEWKVACCKQDWSNDLEMCAQIETSEKRNGLSNLLSIGYKKMLIGGGSVQVVLSGFSRVQAAIEFPFGGDIPDVNQVTLGYNVNCDLNSGGLKHGVSVNF